MPKRILDRPRPLLSRLTVVVAVLAALLVPAAPAGAHASFVSSIPSAGSTIPALPAQVVINFSEKIEPSFGEMQIIDRAGAQTKVGKTRIDGERFTGVLGTTLAPGDYTVAYRVLSGDGQLVESRFEFTYTPGEDSGASSSSAVQPLESEASTTARPPLREVGAASSAGLWIVRLVNYILLTLIVGLLLAGAFLFKQDKEQRQVFGMAAELSLLWALSAILLFALALSVASARALPDALREGLPQQFAGTRFGRNVLIQGALALALALFAWLAARGEDKVLRRICVGIAGLALLMPGLWGHAGTSQQVGLALASDWAHLVSVTSWVGGLAILALFVLRPGSQMEIGGPSARFSKVAGFAVMVVLITGIVNALMRIDSPGLLRSTQWGRLVLIKLVLFTAIAAIGYRNRRRLLPAISAGRAGGRKAFRKMAAFELVLMMLSIMTATALASTVPSKAEAASRIQSTGSPIGEGLFKLTMDPASVGDNRIQLEFVDFAGKPLKVARPTVILTAPGTTLKVRMIESGAGRYNNRQVIEAPGTYVVTVTARFDGVFRAAAGVLEIR